MATTHKVDGTSLTYIERALWSQDAVNQSLDIIAVHSRFKRLVWLSSLMAMSEWETLMGKRGSTVTLVTTDHEDPNADDYITYYDARVDRVSKQSHDAQVARGVRVEFFVRT